MRDSIVADLRYAARSLLARPGFALVVILTLGLGIGANTAIFSAVNSLLLRDPPFRDPDRLVRITSVRGDEDGGGLTVPELDDLLTLPVIDSAAMYTDQGMYNASGFGTPEELQATIATHNLFRVLGVEPLIGSTFPAGFDRTRNFGLVISHGLWVRRFGRDPNIVGRTMTLDGAPGYTIYGVMPPAFNFPSHSDLFRSSGISANPDYYRRRDARERFVLARLRTGMQIDLDLRVAVFLAGATVLTAVVTGVVPALRATARAPQAALKEGVRGSSDGVRHRRLRSMLIVSEVALAVVLLVGASLMLRSLSKLAQVDLGFSTDRALTFRVELGWAAYGTLEKTVAFHQRVIARLHELRTSRFSTY